MFTIVLVANFETFVVFLDGYLLIEVDIFGGVICASLSVAVL